MAEATSSHRSSYPWVNIGRHLPFYWKIWSIQSCASDLTEKEGCSLQSSRTCPASRYNPEPFACAAKLSVVVRVRQRSWIRFHPADTSESSRGSSCCRRWCHWSWETWSQMQSPFWIPHALAQVKLGSEVALSRGASHNALTCGTRITGCTTVS